MHLEEAVLTVSTTGKLLLAGGWAAAALGTAIGLRRLDYQRIPQVAMLSAAFFVASLVHLPLGFASVHLVLNGLVGLVLGWAAFPAVLVALGLQALLFGFGGLTTLGINTVLMALPAVAVFALCNRPARSGPEPLACGAAFAAGAMGILLGALLLAGTLALAGSALDRLAVVVLLAHLPVAAVEGFVTAGAVLFLRKARPEVLEAPLVPGLRVETFDA